MIIIFFCASYGLASRIIHLKQQSNETAAAAAAATRRIHTTKGSQDNDEITSPLSDQGPILPADGGLSYGSCD